MINLTKNNKEINLINLNNSVLKEIDRDNIKEGNNAYVDFFLIFLIIILFIYSIFIEQEKFIAYLVLAAIIPCIIKIVISKIYLFKKNIISLNIPEHYKSLKSKKEYKIISIDDYLFKNCKKLRTILIPYSITKIGKESFSGCTNLLVLTIPKSVNKIGDNAFLDVKNVFYDGTAIGAPWGAKKLNGKEIKNIYKFRCREE